MYKVVIGLEVHCELTTKSKNFSTAKNTFTSDANTNVMPVDIGLPGILPVVNEEAVNKALKLALALNCTLPDEIIFDRKNYFYADLPKGYQITQVTKPVGVRGSLDVRVDDVVKNVEITQIHLEEDTASLEHFSKYSLIDYNRSGIPLVEIVTEPCIHSAKEAVAFLKALRNIFLYTGVSDADSKKGQMRCDVNISLMKEGSDVLGTKVEMKNINAFNIVESSIEYEIKRQTEALEKGEIILQQTRRYSEEDGRTYSMRDKVDALDYKYFIDPNLAPVKIENELIQKLKNEIPVLEFERFNKYKSDYGFSSKVCGTLVKDVFVSNYFDEVISYNIDPGIAVNWVITVILGSINKLNITINEMFVTPRMLADVINLINKGDISDSNAKKVLYESMEVLKNPIDIINEKGIKQIDNKEELVLIIKDILINNKKQVSEYISGNDKIIGFFVGQIMIKTDKQANPKLSNELLRIELERIKNEK